MDVLLDGRIVAATKAVFGRTVFTAPEGWEYRKRLRWIYFIDEGYAGSPIKIGSSVQPFFRLLSLQTGNHRPLELLGLFPDPEKCWESVLHRQFDDIRISGEWFLPRPDLVEFIAWICQLSRREPRGR